MPVYAAIDLGSNTVRMDLAGADGVVFSTEREAVRLGESVFSTGAVSEAAMGRLFPVLRRMAERSAGSRRRAVATAAIREASNQTEFIARASAALGFPVDLVSGEEEARLIEAGVRRGLPNAPGNLLIIDVGGGSTEIISPAGVWSLPLGALRLRTMFLAHDPPSAAELLALEDFIDAKSEPVAEALRGTNVDAAIGTSATSRAVTSGGTVSAAEARRFYEKIRSLDLAARREIEGINPDRAELITPGAAVLVRLLQNLKLPSITYSPAGLCAGIVADLFAAGT